MTNIFFPQQEGIYILKMCFRKKGFQDYYIRYHILHLLKLRDRHLHGANTDNTTTGGISKIV